MAPKIQIPDSLKADLPQNKWGKLLVATPIVMTVIATMLAGLATSEMTKAQYDRSLAAQLQSKAGDQWGYFQAKKLRSAVAHNSLDMLLAMGEISPLGAPTLKNADAVTIAALTETRLPEAKPAKFDVGVQTAIDAVAGSQPEAEIATDLAQVSDATLARSLIAAVDAASAFDAATKSINQAVDKLDETLMNGKDKEVARSFAVARLRYTSARYDTESRLNQSIANIYELQVRKGNLSAERHHRRSQRFFFGMLAAQMGVIVSTFAIAARQKSFLWSLAAAAGLVAVSFSVYVFLCV
jgi:hypothetical protein